MSVKLEKDEPVTASERPAHQFPKSDFWADREELLRGHLDGGMNLHQAAEAIGATYSATEAKARRLGIWPRRRLEAASWSEWDLAGYGGGEGLTLSGDQEIAPEKKRRSHARKKPAPPEPAGLVALIPKPPAPIAADSPSEEERGGGPAAGEESAESEKSAEGEFNADQIPSKRKRPLPRPKPPKLVLSTPVEAVENDAKMMVQLEATPSPTKRSWEFPPPGGCLFPFGDVGQPGFSFCAEPIVRTGVPYCREHTQRVYGRGTKEEAGDG